MTIQNLHNLVHQLTTPEQTLIRYALKDVKEEGENKYRQLFEYIVRNKKELSRHAASIAIYHSRPDTRINKLISRLWEKILDIITSENFLRKNTRLAERSRLRINARKRMTQYIVLAMLGEKSDEADLLIEQGIQSAMKSEYYIMLIELYYHKKNMAVFNSNSKGYEFCMTQLVYFKNCRRVEEKLMDYYNELIKDGGYGNTSGPIKKLKFLEFVLNDLKKEKIYIVSVYTNYIYCLIQLDYLFHKENYSAARKLLRKLLRTFGSSSLAKGTMHIPFRVENELCNCELLSGNYEAAVEHAEKAIAMILGKSSSAYYFILETLFLSVFFSGRFIRAENLIRELESYKGITLNDFRIAKMCFFHACVHFKKQEYKQALQIINTPMPLNRDKTSYDIAIRILRIQCFVELLRFDEASAQIENLRKHISRNYKKTYTSERDKLITRTLVLMQKRGFSNKPGKAEADLIAKLSLPSGKYKWSPITPELIRFHEWYK
jgi:hypothetical protein